jgi:hypothetical protein
LASLSISQPTVLLMKIGSPRAQFHVINCERSLGWE